MPLVRVWNDNVHPFRQTFKGEEIAIPPRSFIMMDREEAIQFKGTFSPIERDGGGVPLPTSYKMIRVERTPPSPEEREAVEAQHVNPVTGRRFATKAELEADLKAYATEHPDAVAHDAEAEAEIKAQVPRRGPGRPKKAEVPQ